MGTEVISPARAQDMLTRLAPHQRPLNARRVDQYARDMAAGRWYPGNDAITIDADGWLVNGQHRLQAIIKAGKAVEEHVVYGVDPRAFATMDCGQARSIAQTLRVSNKAATVFGGLARYSLTGQARYIALTNTRSTVTRGEIQQIVGLFDGFCQEVLHYDNVFRSTFGFCSTLGMTAALAAIGMRESRDAAIETMQDLATAYEDGSGTNIRLVAQMLATLKRDRSTGGVLYAQILLRLHECRQTGRLFRQQDARRLDLDKYNVAAGNELRPLMEWA